MAPRGKRAVERTSGSRVSRGRGRTSVETVEGNLREVVNDIPISDTQRELLDEEREEGGDNEVMDVTDDDTTIDAAEPLLPPGNSIPKFTMQSWKSEWRRHFFSDWRWEEKKKGSGHQVWARCNTEKCQTIKKPHYYSGELTSFSNFEKHLKGCH
jgi:hypothetical protein